MTSPPALSYDTIYHIYNRGVNRANIFVVERDYERFLALLERHVLPVTDLFAYNLLRNHFHLAVRIRSEQEIASAQGLDPGRILIPSVQFSNCFNAYAKAFNARYGRTGSLFQHPFGRKAVLTEDHFRRLLVYIHRNPQTHGLIDDFREWKYSSYGVLTQETPTTLAREAVWNAYGTRRGVQEAHETGDGCQELEWLAEQDFSEEVNP